MLPILEIRIRARQTSPRTSDQDRKIAEDTIPTCGKQVSRGELCDTLCCSKFYAVLLGVTANFKWFNLLFSQRFTRLAYQIEHRISIAFRLPIQLYTIKNTCGVCVRERSVFVFYMVCIQIFIILFDKFMLINAS